MCQLSPARVVEVKMRVVRSLVFGSRSAAPFAVGVLLLSLILVPVVEIVAQTIDSPRFRLTQVLDEPVIDLEDPAPEDPRYNTIAVADVDGDDISDLVAVNFAEGLVNLYLGLGDGMFEDPQPIEDDRLISPVAVVVADFTGPFEENDGAPDGNPDLFVIDEDGTVALFIGDGDGGFGEPDQDVEFVQDLADSITGAVSADFDRDGTLDVAIADGDEVIFVCNDEGTMGACPTTAVVIEGILITDLVTGDFDGDGFPDVVVVDPEMGNAYAFWGNGMGNFAYEGIPIALPSEGEPTDGRLAVANFNNAGPADFVVINNSTFGTNGRTFLGSNNRSFRPFALEAPEESSGLIAGDFNRDGVADVLGANSTGAWYMPGNSTGDFSSNQGAIAVSEAGSPRALTNAQVLKSVDLNRDGLLDLVGVVAGGQQIHVALNVGDTATPTAGPTSPPGTPTPPMSPTPMGPTPTFTPIPPTATPTPLPTAPLGRCDYRVSAVSATGTVRGVVAADLNGAGGPDIAVSDGTFVHIIGNSEFFPNTTLRTCAENQRGGQQPGPPPDLTMASVAGAADLAVLDLGEDATGDLEIAVVGTAGISFLMRGGTGGLFAPVTSLTVPITGNPTQIVTDYASNPLDQRRRAPLDIDGDGNTDILVANLGSLNVSILYGGNGLTAFEQVLLNVGSPTRSIAAGDVNDDGRIDFVVAANNGRIFYVVQRAGSGPRPDFVIGGTFDAGSPVEALQTGFFNDDARADVFFADASPRTRVLVSNPGNLSNPTQFAGFPITGQPSAVATLLFDPIDARLDAVVAVPGGNHLAFGLGAGDGGFGTPLQPLATGPGPRDIAVADVDVDTQFDVVTANADGSVSILISSAPPPTPTPTVTPTSTETGTPTMTGTATPSMTETMTPAGTNTPTVRTATPTNTKAGIFELSGNGCAIVESNSAGAQLGLLIFLAAIVAGRTAARSDGRSSF